MHLMAAQHQHFMLLLKRTGCKAAACRHAVEIEQTDSSR